MTVQTRTARPPATECGDTVPADADLHPAPDGRDLCSDCLAEFHLSLEEPAPDTTGTAAAR
jgi:hypothetical protein